MRTPLGRRYIAEPTLSIERLLRYSPLCQGLDNAQIRYLIDALRPVSFVAGDVILRQGEPGQSMYVIAAGRVRVTLSQAGAPQRLLEILGPGDHFGDMALLGENVRSATITAAVDSQLLELDRERFNRLLLTAPAFAANLSRVLERRLRLAMTRRRRRERPIVVGMVNTSARTQGLIRPLAAALIAQNESIEILTDRREAWAAEGQYLVERIPAAESTADRVRLVHERIQQVIRSHDRVLVELTPGTEAELSQLLAPCDEIWWLVESRFAEAAIERLRRLVAFAPRLASRVHIVWLLNSKERFSPRRPDDLPIARLDFKVNLSDDLSHASWRSRQGIQRLVHHLRGTRLGVALGGGGARGLAHLGALRVLDREGIHFDVVAGTSVGALMGLAYAGGWRPDDALREFQRVLRPPRWASMLPKGARWYLWWKYWRSAWDAMLRPYLQDTRLEQLPTPLCVLAVDLVSGKQVVRDRGDCIHAVMESINLPYFSRPIRRDGLELVDGGVLNNLPGDVLPEFGADFVVGIDVTSKLPADFGVGAGGPLLKARGPGLLETLLRVSEVQAFGLTALQSNSIDLLIAPDASPFDFADFGCAEALAEAGEAAVSETLPQLKQMLANLKLGGASRRATNDPDGI
ncbi:MAG TPA: cyclic nucleotide-binding and patatin-like phospholipase domain-containing protein [Pirellulales bacterium]|nr:cyclic nucleotide-binding and patatin-like phospholipase domain-containing protein [Pirellulales bacterium]